MVRNRPESLLDSSHILIGSEGHLSRSQNISYHSGIIAIGSAQQLTLNNLNLNRLTDHIGHWGVKIHLYLRGANGYDQGVSGLIAPAVVSWI